MKTGSLTDPYGNLLGSGGAGFPPPLDANHIYVYACSEPNGAKTLSNSGNGANGDLTIQGSEYTNYVLNSKAFGKNCKSFRNLIQGGIGGAWSGTACFMTGTSTTLETFVMPNCMQASVAAGTLAAAYGNTPGTDFIILETTSNDTSYRVRVGVSGILLTTGLFTLGNDMQAHHVMASYNGTTGTVNVYVDGAIEVTATYGIARSFQPMISFSIGNAYNSTTSSYRGWMNQVRFSNIERSVSYAATTTEILINM